MDGRAWWLSDPDKRRVNYALIMVMDYEECVAKYSGSFTKVRIGRDCLCRIEELARDIVARKAGESHHRVDHNNEIKRFTTGLMGEAALEKLLGVKIIDWTVGDSSDYHRPDIPGYRVGIKTVERGKFPIIFKENRYPQIICVRSDKVEDLVFVCGLATPDVLNECQSDSLIVDPNLRRRGTKTGFWGFHRLIPVNGIEDLAFYEIQ